MSKNVVIIGAGGHGKVIADMILQSGDHVIGFLDDGIAAGSQILGIPVLGGIAKCYDIPESEFVIALGNGALRKKIATEYSLLKWYSPRHPQSCVSTFSKIGEGSSVHAMAVVNPSAEIGRHCIINTGAIVEHDCVISDFSHMAPNSALGGGVFLGNHVFIGVGSAVRNGIHITSDVTIGCGSTVVKDITEPGIYAGCPVRKIK